MKIPPGARLIVFVVGDENGEDGPRLAKAFTDHGYRVSAMALILNIAHYRGDTVVQCAAALGVPMSVVEVEHFDDPYQVPRVLQTILEAPPPSPTGRVATQWVDKVLKTPLLTIV